MVHDAPVRLRYHNRLKVLLIYLLALALMAAPCLALFALYPTVLAGSAPDLTPTLASLSAALPLPGEQTLAAAAVDPGMDRSALLSALAARDRLWLATAAAFLIAAAALSLLWQLVWRAFHRRSQQTADAVLRAIAGYRRSMLGIWLINLAFAFGLYLVGVRWIAGRTAVDYLLYFSGFAVNPLAMMLCFRLAAPSTLSGRRAFFLRL